MNEKQVDLDKYVGKWNEIDSFPAWFQKGCKNTTAEYTDKGDFIEVNNSCDITQKDGTVKRKRKLGKAFRSKKLNTLKVQFFFPFRADYKIEHLDTDKKGNYENVLVGSSKKKYAWILSRKKKLSDTEYDKLVKIAKDKGYNITKFQKYQDTLKEKFDKGKPI